jgi:hypothetical protein
MRIGGERKAIAADMFENKIPEILCQEFFLESTVIQEVCWLGKRMAEMSR